MSELIEQEVLKKGDKVKIISIECLQKLKQDIVDLKENDSLSDVTKGIIGNYDHFDLPPLDFKVRSIVVVISPSPLVKVTFNWKSKRIPLMIPPTYVDMNRKPIEIENYLNEVLNPEGFHVKSAPALPQKILAVRSGLCAYGRNNICYNKDMGSFLKIATYYSDVPSTEERWHELRQMDSCKTCKLCLNNCPTKAITPESHYINAGRCLTHFNEHAGVCFPEWIPPTAHNNIYGCTKCQTCCPHNKAFLNHIIEPVEFNEEETNFLLEGKPLEQLSEELIEKMEILDMLDYLDFLPRNLKVFFA